MRLKVLMQYARGLLVSDPEAGSKVLALLESIKRYLWHGNVVAALEHIDNCISFNAFQQCQNFPPRLWI